MKNSYYSEKELRKLGFLMLGENVLLSKNASVYGHENISINDNTRIDDFCILSASRNESFSIGKNVHISAGVYIFGNSGFEIADFGTISSGCKIFTQSDDYSGEFLTNPTIPNEFRGVVSKKITIEKHGIIGAGSILLPGSHVSTGTAVGSMSLVNIELESWSLYAGIPVKKISDRKRKLLDIEKQFHNIN